MDAHHAIEKAIDEAFAAQVAWLSRLVHFKSLRGQEGPCQAWLQSEFEQRGWSVDRFTLADVALRERPGYAPMSDEEEMSSVQLVASVPTARQAHGKSVILQGHVDVVPEGPEEFWTRPPFSGEVEGDWLYGRGAQDMKMGVSALVFALDAIKAAGFMPAAPVFVQAVTEEESTGNGALAALVRGYRADACLIPEPTSNTITRAQTGAVWFKLRVFAKPVHVAKMETGANAILLAYPFLDALQKLADNFNEDAAGDEWFCGVTNPVKFNPGLIRGGDWASSTPSWCDVDCRMGVLPSVTVEAVMNRIIETVHDVAEGLGLRERVAPQVVWNGFRAEGAVLLPGDDAESCLAKAHERVFGQPMQERLSTAVNDTRYHNLYFGIPGLCYGPRGKGMHGVDERADLANLRMTTLVIASFICNWCGLAPVESTADFSTPGPREVGRSNADDQF